MSVNLKALREALDDYRKAEAGRWTSLPLLQNELSAMLCKHAEELVRLARKGELLEWAENHPAPSLSQMSTMWTQAGRGYREGHFNFSGCIEQAKSKEPTA